MNPNVKDGGWEQRWHPLRREWVVYTAHRNARPWKGQSEAAMESAPAWDKDCYLCPKNERVGGHRNPDYLGVFVFDNDNPVVSEAAPDSFPAEASPLYRRAKAEGLARVVCYDPRHHLTLNDLPLNSVANVMTAWQQETAALIKNPRVNFGLIFENKGKICGVSSPHPHCQLYGTNFVFKHIEAELEALKAQEGKNLFDEILGAELASGARIVAENDEAVAFIPFFARYSYETWVLPKQRHATLATLSPKELLGLADVYQRLTRKFDLLYGISFPYVMSLYQAPLDGGAYSGYHLHFVFLPPLRRPGVQKFPAGPEIGGGNFMCDTLPEDKAAELRALDPAHYKVLK